MQTKNKSTNGMMALVSILCIWLAMTTDCFAQTPPSMVAPTLSDNYWFSSASNTDPFQGLNTAMISYNNASTGSGFIYAAAYYDGTGTSRIYVSDDNILASPVNIVSTGSMVGGVPDIIIGNATGGLGTICPPCNPHYDYILAAAYVNTNGDAQIDYYRINDDGSSNLSINPITSYTVTGSASQTVHIDVIADYATTGATNLPLCNKYVIAWDDFTGLNPLVYADYGDLNANTLAGPTLITTGPMSGKTPDVSGIRRSVGGTVHDFALVTYLNRTGTALHYSEWDVTTTVGPAGTLQGTSPGLTVAKPRIDAYDDHNGNNNSANGNYQVVAEVFDPWSSLNIIVKYGNVGPYPLISNYVDASSGSSGLPGPSYNHYAPTIALASDGTGTYIYSVQHFTKCQSGATNDVLFMEPVDLTASIAILSPPNQYYWVNGSSVASTIESSTCGYANAVCAAPDDYARPTLYAWAYDNGGASFDVNYKMAVPNGSLAYAFRKTPSKANDITKQDRNWQLHPNPVTDQLTLTQAGDKHESIGYRITDVTGRVMLKDTFLPGSRSQIDVSKLLPGTYMITIYQNDIDDGHSIFVKN